MPTPHRCGTVAIIGRPNVGKSTLLNRFLGQKIAIVSPKPETTRERLLGILTLEGAQVLFLDTPGIYRGPKTLLGQHQVQAARDALAEADAVLMVTEAHAGITEEDVQIMQMLPRDGKTPVFLAINKMDRIEKALALPQIEQASKLFPFRGIHPVSGTRKQGNLDPLLDALTAALPEGPALYPPDQVTDRPVRALVQDLIREKTLIFTHEEVPHAVAVMIEEWRAGTPSKRGTAPVPADEARHGGQARGKQAPNATYIRATLYLERSSQKGIMIGKEGGLLKKIGQAAREEIEKLIEGPVYLDLWVKVAENWRKDPSALKRMGY